MSIYRSFVYEARFFITFKWITASPGHSRGYNFNGSKKNDIMVYKETKIKCADNSGAFVLKTIHVFQRKQVQLGNFVQIVLNKFDTRKKLQKKKNTLVCL